MLISANTKQNQHLFSRLKETLNPQMCRGYVDAFLLHKKNLEVGKHFITNPNITTSPLLISEKGNDIYLVTMLFNIMNSLTD